MCLCVCDGFTPCYRPNRGPGSRGPCTSGRCMPHLHATPNVLRTAAPACPAQRCAAARQPAGAASCCDLTIAFNTQRLHQTFIQRQLKLKFKCGIAEKCAGCIVTRGCVVSARQLRAPAYMGLYSRRTSLPSSSKKIHFLSGLRFSECHACCFMKVYSSS